MAPTWCAQGGEARSAGVALPLCSFLACLPGHRTRGGPYSTLEPQCQEHCSSTALSLNYSPLQISTYHKRSTAVPQDPRWNGSRSPQGCTNSLYKMAQKDEYNRAFVSEGLTHSQIQPNTKWHFGRLHLQMRNLRIRRADYILHHIILMHFYFTITSS